MFDFKEFRKQNKLTQIQAAEYFGCVQGFISQMETGRSPVPEAFISKIIDDGIYIVPNATNITPTQLSERAATPHPDKYVSALEALIAYKDKEITELKAAIAELKKELERCQRT